jgi:hypothetical protein
LRWESKMLVHILFVLYWIWKLNKMKIGRRKKMAFALFKLFWISTGNYVHACFCKRATLWKCKGWESPVPLWLLMTWLYMQWILLFSWHILKPYSLCHSIIESPFGFKNVAFSHQRRQFVGIVVCRDGNSPAGSKFIAIQKLEPPRLFSDFRIFIGLLGFYALWGTNCTMKGIYQAEAAS